MFNWKKKIDDQEETEKRDRERREAEEKARQVANKERAVDDEKQSRMRKLAQFRCHICKNLPQDPAPQTIITRSGFQSEGAWGIESLGESTVYNWEKPTDRWQCTKCNKWTCAEHIHKGICQTCAEKM